MKKPKRPTLKEYDLTQADVETGNRFIRAKEQLGWIDEDKTWWRHSLFVFPAVVAWYIAKADDFSFEVITGGLTVGIFGAGIIGRLTSYFVWKNFLKKGEKMREPFEEFLNSERSNSYFKYKEEMDMYEAELIEYDRQKSKK